MKKQRAHILAASLAASSALAAVVRAQTFTVTNSNDTGSGSLRNAIALANAYNGAATINFNSSLGTIQLASVLPTLTNSAGITINGNGGIVSAPAGTDATLDYGDMGFIAVGGTPGGTAFTITAGNFTTLAGTTVNGGTGGNDNVAATAFGASDDLTGGAGVAMQSAGVLTNGGQIAGGSGGGAPSSDSGAGGTGIVASIANASINNTGTIAGGNGGAAADTAGNGGTGIQLNAFGFVSNSGTISGGSSGSSDNLPGNGGAGLNFSAGGSLTNTGTITGGNGAGTDFEDVSAGNGGNAISFSTGGSVINSGTITAGAPGIGANTVGTAGAALAITGGVGTFTNLNHGVINGNVSLDNYANNLTLQIGSAINGNLNVGSNSNSILTLTDDGTGGTQNYSAAVTGTTTFFGSLIKNGNGKWVIDESLNSGGSTTINAGTLQLGNGTNPASLVGYMPSGIGHGTGGSAVTINSGGVFAVQAGASVTGGTGQTGGGGIGIGGTGGVGAAVAANGSVFNTGTLSGGAGGGVNANNVDGGIGGAGVTLAASASLTNTAIIQGGNGGNSIQSDGGNGGNAINLASTASLSNTGTISGGNGGNAPNSTAGTGGIGINAADGSALAIGGAVIQGGNGGNSMQSIGGYAGGNGGAAISFSGSGSLNNGATLTGGNGGSVNAVTARFTSAGNGAAGVSFAGIGSLTNTGTILAGSGGNSTGVPRTGNATPPGGAGGAAAAFFGGGTLTNSGTLVGGAGGIGTASTNGANGAGALFVNAAGTLSNLKGGAIIGGVSMGNYANSVTLQIGSTINGNLNIGTSTPSTLTLTDNGTGGTQNYSAAVGGATTFNGSLIKAGIGTWVLDQALTYSGGTTINAGTLQVSGSGFGTTTMGSGPVTINAGGTLVGTNQDAFGYAGFAAPGTITINGGTVTDLGTSNYRVTLPNLIFTGGTLTSAAGNAGDPYGNFSLYGNGGSASVVTNASATTATLSAASVAVELPTTFTVAAGSTPSGVDLIVSSNLNGSFSPFGSYGITKAGPGTMELTASNTYPGKTTITAGTLAISGSIASTSVTLDGTNNFASLKLMSATALSTESALVVNTASATTIALDFNGNQTVSTWEINGTYEQPGVYSTSNEPPGYPNLLTSDVNDNGTLTVSVPEPSLAGAGVLAIGSLLARRRRSRR